NSISSTSLFLYFLIYSSSTSRNVVEDLYTERKKVGSSKRLISSTALFLSIYNKVL
ncbi:hypothetical protein MKW98_026890, partial [Papaver atlanticum]